MIRTRFAVALVIALGLLAVSCKDPRVGPKVGGPVATPNECVPTCTDRECAPESDGCGGNCDPGSGCYVPTGYCVPDATTKLCPPVAPPECKPGKHHGHDKGDHNEDGHPDNGR